MNILTFDIEDWYHILHKYPSDILEKWSFTADGNATDVGDLTSVRSAQGTTQV